LAAAAFDNRKTVRGIYKMLPDDYWDKKWRSSYNWFFSRAKWDANAQRKVEIFHNHPNQRK